MGSSKEIYFETFNKETSHTGLFFMSLQPVFNMETSEVFIRAYQAFKIGTSPYRSFSAME